LLDNLCGMFRGGCCNHGCGCCEASCCCESSCCCEPSCGCGCGDGCGCGNGDHEEAAPAESDSARMMPPLPMSDPNASIGRQRDVVRTSFTR
jgi:hypothetical protein